MWINDNWTMLKKCHFCIRFEALQNDFYIMVLYGGGAKMSFEKKFNLKL